MNCKHCNGQMKPGKAIANTFNRGMPDFPGDKNVVTLSPGGPGKLIDCLKCVDCGWSVTCENLLHPGKGRIVRSFNRAITPGELVRITSWHTMAEKRPEHGQKVNFQLIEDRYSGPIETGIYSTFTGFIHNDEKCMFFSTPEHTYWMPVEEPKGLFVDMIAEHPGLADEMTALPTMSDALAAGDGLLHARIDALEAQVAALTTAIAQCRDAFPAPTVGSDLDGYYVGAVADPLAVPDYVGAQVAALTADANRYRAIRDGLEVDPNHQGAAGIVVSLVDDFGGEALHGEAADKAIDAAMAQKGAV